MVWRRAPRWRRCPGSRTRDAKSPPACLPEFNLIAPIDERMTSSPPPPLARRTAELLFLSSCPHSHFGNIAPEIGNIEGVTGEELREELKSLPRSEDAEARSWRRRRRWTLVTPWRRTARLAHTPAPFSFCLQPSVSQTFLFGRGKKKKWWFMVLNQRECHCKSWHLMVSLWKLITPLLIFSRYRAWESNQRLGR